MRPYKDKAEVIEALTVGKLTETSAMMYARNKNLSDARRSMFKVAVYEHRIEKLKALIAEEEKLSVSN